MGGVFCREQVAALADCTDCNFTVCDWGQKDGAISLVHPLQAARNLIWWLGARQEVRQINKQFHEFFQPTLQWSPKLPRGGQQQVLAAIRRIVADAAAQFGNIDLIHAHVCNPGGYLAALIAEEIGIPFVLTEHWGAFPGELVNGRPRPEIELAMNRAAAVISVSHAAAQKITTFGYQRICVIPNLVDENRFIVKPLPAVSPFRFFSMGGLTKGKGFDILLRAIAKWDPPIGEVEFVIAGEGPLKQELQMLTKQLKIERLIKWVGSVSRVEAPVYYQQSHAFVLASRAESFGVVFVEAMASGRPVIATRCGGPEDIVNDKNGTLVPLGDDSQLALALKNMKENYQQYNPDAIREDFMRKFSRRPVTGQIRRVYAEVLRKI